jgi:mono/diheme cytochrome c family protein
MRKALTQVNACIAGILIGPLLAASAVGVVLWTGGYNVAATNIPGDLEVRVAAFAVNHAVQKRAPVQTNPFSTPEDIRAGMVSYQQNCLACHGARGVPEAAFGRGLNPPAPDLTLSFVRRLSDGELYWIVSHGIRMTGMPAFLSTHTAEEIWKIVAFVRHMPDLTKEEQRALKADRERGLQSMDNAQTVKKEVEHEEEPSS